MRFTEKPVKKRFVYDGGPLLVRDDVVRLPNGKKATRMFFDHPGAAGVLAFKDPRTVVLVRQYRYPVGVHTLEVPAGKVHRGGKPLPTMRRELLEETGYTARRWRRLLPYWPTPAFSNEVLHLFVATGLKAGTAAPDEDEFLEVVEIPYKELLRKVLTGKILDSKTIIAVLAYEAALRRGRRRTL